MKNTLLIGFFSFLIIAPSHLLSAGFNVSGASVTLVGPMILTTMDDVTLSSGSFDAGNALVQVGGNWNQISGTFIPGTSTVTFQDSSSSLSSLTGSTAFYSLQCVSAGKTLTFAAGSTQTVRGSLIFTGTVANPVRVRSSVSGTYAYLTNSGTNTVNNVDAQDNNASGGLPINAESASVNSGHTVNWFFSASANPPSGFTGIALGVSSISWTWNAVTAATSYRLYDADAPTTLITSVAINNFIETGLSPSTTYRRVVTAIVGGVESNLSNSATVVTLNNVGSGSPTPTQFSLLPGSPYPRILTPSRPENRRLFFLFNNPNHESVGISIYDFQNRKIRDLDASASAPIAGAETMVWDVKDDSGHIVPGGIYLYKIKAGDVTKTGGVVVAR